MDKLFELVVLYWFAFACVTLFASVIVVATVAAKVLNPSKWKILFSACFVIGVLFFSAREFHYDLMERRAKDETILAAAGIAVIPYVMILGSICYYYRDKEDPPKKVAAPEEVPLLTKQ